MKKIQLFAVLVLFTSVSAFSQISMFKNGHWSLTAGAGFNRLDADLSPSTSQAITSFLTSPTGLVEAGYSFNHILTAGLGMNLDYINQADENEYTWMITQNLYPYVSVDFLSMINGYKHPKWSLSAMLGFGVGSLLETYYINTLVYDKDNLPAVLNPLYISEDARGTKIRDYDVSYATMVAGGVVEYAISKSKSLGLRLMLNKTNSDKLETTPRSDKNDYIESLSFTFKYKILDRNGNHASDFANFVPADKGCCNDLDAYRDQILKMQEKLDKLESDGVNQDAKIKELENRPVSSGNFVDTDGDGVADMIDKCPNEIGTTINNGCPDLLNFKLDAVHFALNSSKLLPTASPVLDSVATVLNEYKDITVEVAGYTSSEGSVDYNLNLSQKRAESVVKYIRSKGVASERMTARGYGEANPAFGNGTLEGRQKNRRVVFVVK